MEERWPEGTHQALLQKAGLEFLLSRDGKVHISSIRQKKLCLLFSANWCRPCRKFAPLLMELYDDVNRDDGRLEIVFISCDRDEASFEEHLQPMPWLAAPFDASLTMRLRKMYKINRLPSLVPLSLDGRTVEEDAVQLAAEYGADAFPFGSRRGEELKEIDEEKRRGGPLLDLLGSRDRDYVIGRDGSKVPITTLVGKTIGLYFGACWCPPCNSFSCVLVEEYEELRRDNATSFEVVFVSRDRDAKEFLQSLNTMPWLAVPYLDKTRRDLTRIFSIACIPSLVLLGSDGRRIESDGRAMMAFYGAKSFPFTEARVLEVKEALEKEGETLPKLVVDSRHQHSLKLDMAKAYICDSCSTRGRFWVFSCEKCDYDLHPSCVEHEPVVAAAED